MIYLSNNPSYEEFCSHIYEYIGIEGTERNPNGIPEIIPSKIIEKFYELNPIIFCDNYKLIEKEFIEGKQNLIYNFLKNIPNKKLILTSTIRNSIFGNNDSQLILEGLKQGNAIKLFRNSVRDNYEIDDDEETNKKIQDLAEKVDFHPLALELLARIFVGGNVESILSNFNNHLDTTRNNEEFRKKSITACINYSLDNLDSEELKVLRILSNLKTSFPEIIGIQYSDSNPEIIHSIHDKGLLRQLDSINNTTIPREYWLYDIHPIIKEVLKKQSEVRPDSKKYFNIYQGFLAKTENLFEEGNANPSILFNLLLDGENDFDAALKLHESNEGSSLNSCRLGIILRKIGSYGKAIQIHDDMGSDIDIARNARHLGVILLKQKKYNKAIELIKKAYRLDVPTNYYRELLWDSVRLAEAFHLNDQKELSIRYYNKTFELINKVRCDLPLTIL